MNRLRVQGLRYQGRGPIDLEIEAGECASFSGPSGSGKTLLLRALADLDPHEGRVSLDGIDCTSVEAPEWRKQVALLPSESRWWHDTTGEHFAALDPTWLDQLGFPADVASWPIARLSTGERQRLALLRLLVESPAVLLLDEPTANLDEQNIRRMEQLIGSYRRKRGAAVLWVTHDAEQIERVASRRLRLDEGQLLEDPR